MSSQKTDESLRHLLLSSWKHGQDNTCDPHYLPLPPKILCYSDGLSCSTERRDAWSKTRQRFLDDCEKYALNYLLTHLLRTSDMSLVTRTELWEAERPRIEDSMEENLDRLSRRMRDGAAGDPDKWHTPTRSDEVSGTDRDAYVRGLFKFAIFSHRWGDDEPQCRDILNKRLVENPTVGYEKLVHLCRKASADFDCCYVWSDTCCINKESSVELDEAIRSMYRWYSIATVCIVYLAESLSIDDFESESWFNRGWTLQELLAPKMIRFYGKDWTPISQEKNAMGDKAIKAVWTSIEKVTGIPHRDLWHFSPSRDRVAEKMVWASQRKTTKIEDVAYSLLGLFNVSLHIAYGEADRAWYRLMVVLANECTDASFFAWAGKPSPHSRALPSSPTCYAKLDPRTTVSLFHRRHPSYEVTKLGVMIKILVIPIRWSILEDSNGREIGFTIIPHNLEPFLIAADVPHGRIDEYKLGVVNFRFGSSDVGVVATEDECHCVLLAKEHSDDQGWVMVNTECIVVVRCLEGMCVPAETILLYHNTLPSQTHRNYPAVEMMTG